MGLAMVCYRLSSQCERRLSLIMKPTTREKGEVEIQVSMTPRALQLSGHSTALLEKGFPVGFCHSMDNSSH